MTHNDYQCVRKTRYRWQKEQQLIRKKYQIPYSILSTSNQCLHKHISILSNVESLYKYEKLTVTNNNLKTKIYQRDKHNFNIKTNGANNLLIYCSRCNLNRSACSCSNTLDQRQINLKKESCSSDAMSKRFSINSLHKQNVPIDSSLIDLSSIEQTNSQTINSNQYVLLDWNNRQSLMNFIRTTEFNQNLTAMTNEQLHELITSHNYIHIFHSIIDLILFINNEEHEENSYRVYIDPSYYGTIQGTIPFCESHLLADNINLKRVFRCTEKVAHLLGIKRDRSIRKIFEEKLSTKQRKSILNQQSLFIASKIPYNTFHNISVHV
ncbi:unnamed protein product [Rotaria magnacalcarata]|uniref:Uncharacterized protein n=2 Tax=Rotaria magnacalcarata TaxID=392030 RepID=A0A814KHU0_9BILA|nr:unnamed protein product [Rotaria magnacalcarata]CAF1395929.1 unnamed protein product [Rotaria magnacalcarata]